MRVCRFVVNNQRIEVFMNYSSNALAIKAHDHSSNELEQATQQLGRIGTEIKTFTTDAQREIKACNTKNIELQARLSEVEQKLARSSGGAPSYVDGGDSPLAAMAAKSDLLRPLIDQPGKTVLTAHASLRTLSKAITSLTPDNLSGFPTAPSRAPGIYGLPSRSLRLLEVLPSVPFAAASLEHPSLSDDYADAADYQLTEGAEKPESSPEFGLQITNIVTIAHWIRTSKQVLSDAPMLQQWLEQLMRYGVLKKVEHQLINGTGVGKRLKGLLTVATPAVVTATHPVDAVGEAAVLLEVAGWQPSLTIMHPSDAFKIVSERATDGKYVAGGWAAPNQSSFWNLQRVTTPSVPQGTALVLDPNAVLILDREQPTVLASTQDRDNFIKNMVTLLAEIRLGMAILNPQAILSVALPSP
jgi:HK97 family phage major capsid protein